ncbi:uncharacterized protein J3D65DRAFT_635050 [Phyllosticta citribraziliensis]|uniref:Secreted protein n=1 Tax=Phyllosticta citribraziliensis TaxID=989973 RepID=A0ABR1LDI7_9PEZI
MLAGFWLAGWLACVQRFVSGSTLLAFLERAARPSHSQTNPPVSQSMTRAQPQFWLAVTAERGLAFHTFCSSQVRRAGLTFCLLAGWPACPAFAKHACTPARTPARTHARKLSE